MSARAWAGVQARTGSTRLPGKVLADLAGKPLVVRLVERLARCERLEGIAILTSDQPGDDALVEVARDAGIEVRRGSEADVLSRYTALVQETGCDQVVRVTGDAPLLEPELVDRQIAALERFDGDLVHLVGSEDGALDGTLGGQGALSSRALWAAAASRDPRDREHVGSFCFQLHRDVFRHVAIEVSGEYRWPGMRLCVDEAPDLELVRRVFEHFGERPFSTLEALRWLREHEEVAALNRDVGESEDNRASRALARGAHLRPVRTVGRYAG